ncbi:MAG: hypothetical protein HDR88_03280 [Bacteroides sp.]|nr:hypothetical protein [Bacteroides sp.]
MSKIKVYHPRLYAFFQSKVINSMMIVINIALLMTGCTKDLIVPFSVASVSFLLALSYTVWFWIKRPQRIVINSWLSNMSGYFSFYFLSVGAMKNLNELWFIFPAIIGVCLLFVNLIKNHDEVFNISTREISALNQV